MLPVDSVEPPQNLGLNIEYKEIIIMLRKRIFILFNLIMSPMCVGGLTVSWWLELSTHSLLLCSFQLEIYDLHLINNVILTSAVIVISLGPHRTVIECNISWKYRDHFYVSCTSKKTSAFGVSTNTRYKIYQYNNIYIITF